jgi:hypothetical protein
LITRAEYSMENPKLGMEMSSASAMMTKCNLTNHTES